MSRAGEGGEGDGDRTPEGVARLPVDGILDLHTFDPADAEDLVDDYLDACRDAGIRDVRIIHGKGTGRLRERVHSVLRRRDDVGGFRLAGDASGWGATLVRLTFLVLALVLALDGTSAPAGGHRTEDHRTGEHRAEGHRAGDHGLLPCRAGSSE